jgi:hypothetical protein
MLNKYVLIILSCFITHLVCANANTKSNLLYIENNGQWHENVWFKASIQAGSAFLEQDGITYLLAEKPAHAYTIIIKRKCLMKRNILK